MAAKRRSAGIGRRVLIGLVAVLAAALLFPVLQVAFVRFWNPPITGVMIQRRLEHWLGSPYRGGINYHWVPLQSVSDYFLQGVWQMEDSRFFSHDGFDWIEVEEAVTRAKVRHQPVRGVSTISMQCARSLFLWQGRSWLRKGLEAYYTFLLEHLLSKERILELYVNVIELGDGIYGVQAAAQHYYQTSADRLDRAQSAMLAAMLPYPRGWNPLHPNPRLQRRFNLVVRRMNAGGSIERKLGNAGQPANARGR
ncbi:MAG: monofunctional biosynthetic peptidoglycan transglycosylase [Verrucomicrobia bacterium]|nr:monofunctional biosynthetic peptidoglycan transglycosylase [Verrucomicrobiota bacterium]